MFEPIGSVPTAMAAAATGLPPDALLDPQDYEGAINTADPEYNKPCVRDVEAVLIAFDVLYCDEQARRGGPRAARAALGAMLRALAGWLAWHSHKCWPWG